MDEREIGGQFELVRYKAQRMAEELERLDRPIGFITPDLLQGATVRLRSCAEEIEALNTMIKKYQEHHVPEIYQAGNHTGTEHNV